MTDQPCSSQQTYLEQENVYKNSSKEQYLELEHWKLKIEMISNMKNKETQKKNDQLIEMVCILYIGTFIYWVVIIGPYLNNCCNKFGRSKL